MDIKDFIDGAQHAYILTGELGAVSDELKASIEKIFGVSALGNPDFRAEYFETFGIDEARALKEEQSRMAFNGGYKFFVIGAGSVTREAQNALLKVFEEPTKGTYIFLVVPSTRQIIPTLLSRARIINERRKAKNENEMGEVEEFLAAPVDKRLNLPFVRKMIEEKEKQPVILFFNNIESLVHDKTRPEKMSPADREFLSRLIKYRGYAGDRSASVKMLLEHIALITPRIT